MPAKKEEKIVTELKKLVELKKLIVGTDRIMKLVKSGKLAKIFMSANCPETVRADLLHYAKLSGATVVELDYRNNELGTLCKKPFPISIIGVI